MKKSMVLVTMLLIVLTAVIPALSVAQMVEDTPVSSENPDVGNPDLATPPEPEPDQVVVAIVDCVLGGPCIGTSGNDTITGSEEQDIILALEGDDVIDPGNDTMADYVFCGPGFDTVNQMPRVLDDTQGAIQYGSEPDIIAEDCEERAL